MEDRRSGRDRRSAGKPTTNVRAFPALQPNAALPVAPEALPELHLRLVDPPATEDRRRTVLLIDDHHDRRIALRLALGAKNYEVMFAADGVRGADLSRTTLRPIDALIACAEMRRMSGFELARRVRTARPEIAVLLMTRASTSPERPDTTTERGFPVIEEPFTPEELTHRLAEIFAATSR